MCTVSEARQVRRSKTLSLMLFLVNNYLHLRQVFTIVSDKSLRPENTSNTFISDYPKHKGLYKSSFWASKQKPKPFYLRLMIMKFITIAFYTAYSLLRATSEGKKTVNIWTD